MKKLVYNLQLVVILFLLMFFSQCHNYYKAVQTPSGNNASSIDSLKLQSRYFVLRNGSAAYYMNNIILNEDKKTLTCKLELLPPEHQFHLVKGRKGKQQYKKNKPEQLTVLNEVHFYIKPDNTLATGQYTMPLDNVEKIEVIEIDKKRTTSSYVIGAVGYTLAAVTVVGIIALAIKSSCPFVSAYDGTHFSLQGEIFGGAIYPQLARNDYMPLKMAPLPDGSLQLKISNELLERQFTDMAELWVISHDKNTNVYVNEKGNLFTTNAPQLPASAVLNNKKVIITSLQNSGDNALLYMDDTSGNAINELVIQFNKPADAKKAKLLLNLKNSYFLDLLYGEMAKGFGNRYASFIKNQEKKPAAELLKWIKDQHIPLEVSVKTNNGWKKITDITTIGPLAARNMVIPVEVPEPAVTFTEIKLSSGFMFWEIDYAAMDYSDDNSFSIQKINPSKATDELGKNVLPVLQKEDAVYLAQPSIGNTATIVYTISPLTDDTKTRTYILHTRGYYEHIRDFKNAPNIAFLNQFKNPGAFPLFGMQLYKKTAAANLKTIAMAN